MDADLNQRMLTRSKTSTIISKIKDEEEKTKKDNIDSKLKNIFQDSGSKKKKKKNKKTIKTIKTKEDDMGLISEIGDTSNIRSFIENESVKSKLTSLLQDKFKDLTFVIDGEEDGDEDEDEEVILDEYDEKYLDIYDDGDLFTDKNFDYFQNLTEKKKKKVLNKIEKINKINSKNVPVKFKILDSSMPENTKARALSLIDKIDDDGDSSEAHKLEKWIDGLISIPFSKYVPMFKIDKTDTETDTSSVEFNRSYITNVHKCLNDAIYGHDEAKFHIIQHVAKWLKNPDSTGSVMAIQGPMGNGKTTLVKEGIAKALNRPFAFVSLGGASDSSYLNGHSQTYEGSIWGRIADILIKSKCMNPIIYFDELDKVSDTTKGEEIINLLTHLTDFSQNDRFQDNYFSGIDLDLSKVLFIFSFNDETKVNRILKDRMYVINTKGFKVKEKIKISNEYLLPKLYDSFKFTPDDITFTTPIIEHIIDRYTSREEGVRNLQRCLETVLSKLNMYNMYVEPSETSKETPSSDLDLPFKIKDFKLPYTLTIDTINTLLKVDNKNAPPEHMYL